MCGSVYSYILGIRRYMPNTFSALPNWRNRRILANTLCESQFPRLLVNLCENARECWRLFGIHIFSENWRMCGSAFISLMFENHFKKFWNISKNTSDIFEKYHFGKYWKYFLKKVSNNVLKIWKFSSKNVEKNLCKL